MARLLGLEGVAAAVGGRRRGDGDQHRVHHVDEAVVAGNISLGDGAADDLGVEPLLARLLAADADDALAPSLGVDGQLDALRVEGRDWGERKGREVSPRRGGRVEPRKQRRKWFRDG